MHILTLDKKGALLAIALGVALFAIGIDIGYFFVLTMLLFLFLSAVATIWGADYKKKIGIYQTPRGVKNVLANGIPPLIMAAVFSYSILRGHNNLALLSVIGFTASVAAVTADKFASEFGVFGGKPRMIFTFKRVRQGTSGGLSALGLAAGLLGSFIISLMIMLVAYKLQSIGTGVYAFSAPLAIASISLAGFIGNVIDSIFGYYEEKGIGSKFSTNFICGISGAVAAILLYILL
jgi:uncharacterized protein (TIGR00297 family)